MYSTSSRKPLLGGWLPSRAQAFRVVVITHLALQHVLFQNAVTSNASLVMVSLEAEGVEIAWCFGIHSSLVIEDENRKHIVLLRGLS